jgi:hypothetical protein
MRRVRGVGNLGLLVLRVTHNITSASGRLNVSFELMVVVRDREW